MGWPPRTKIERLSYMHVVVDGLVAFDAGARGVAFVVLDADVSTGLCAATCRVRNHAAVCMRRCTPRSTREYMEAGGCDRVDSWGAVRGQRVELRPHASGVAWGCGQGGGVVLQGGGARRVSVPPTYPPLPPQCMCWW